jgi:peptidase C25-like protein
MLYVQCFRVRPANRLWYYSRVQSKAPGPLPGAMSPGERYMTMRRDLNLRSFLALAAGGLLLAAGAAHGVVSGQCVQARGGNSCTAGDVTFILVGLGTQNDGCVTNTTDTLTILLGGQLQNTAANTRYDIGMYIYNNTGTETQPAVSQGFAYNGSSCAREMLKPAGTLNDTRCTFNSPAGSLNLLGGSGPFYNADSDSCSDLLKVQSSSTCDANGDGNWDDSFMVFPDPITVKCFDGTNGAADGFVDIPTCATWGQNANEIGTGGTCSSETDVLPGTPSKCNCQTVNSTVPAPNLSLSCSCSPTTVRTGASNGASTECTVTFTNSRSCTINTSTEERFRCGAASFVQFDTVADTPNGSHIFGQTAGNAPTETTGGSINIGTAGTIRWTPRDTVATGGGTTLGVIGQSQTGTMTFDYFVDPSTPNNTTINFATTAYWSNSASFSPRTAQSALTATCSITTSNNATWARISSFAAREEDGRVVVEWETAAEVGTAAFEVERRDPASGRFVRVSEQAVPAVGQLPGGRYRLVDQAAPHGGTLVYRVVEIDQRGNREAFGPFRVKVEREARAAGRDRDRDFTARGKTVSPRLVEAAVERRTVRSAAAAVARSEKALTPTRAKVAVAGSGMVQVKLRDIAIGLGMSRAEAGGQLRAGRLRLSHGGRDVAWQAADDGDGLVFYGEAIQSPYTNSNVYWLERGKGLLLESVSARPTAGTAAASFVDSLHLEIDAIPAVTAPLPVEDFWIWKSFFPGFPGFDRATLSVDVPAPAPGAATLAVHLYGFAATQRARLRVNGRHVTEIAWSGTGPHTAQVSLPLDVLRDGGGNEIELVALEAERGFWLDSFDLTYPHRYRASSGRLAFRTEAGRAVALAGFPSADIAVYDLAQPLAPRRLTGLSAQPQADGAWGIAFIAPDGGPYVATTKAAIGRTSVQASAPADLRNPGRGAEYLVIAPFGLRSEARRLADLRAAQGLTTMVVDLGDVMDLFADGIGDPAAIQRFLAYAVESWPTPPRYVALAGKGTYDYRNLLGLFSNLVPPLLVTTEDGVAAADAELADFDGSGVPAVAIGRIPAVTSAELRAYVDKVAAYESAPPGAWAEQALLVADDPDSGGDFPATSETVAKAMTPGLRLTRVYAPASPSPEQVVASRSRLEDALRQGQVLMNYVGHGGLDRMSSEGLLLTSDVPQLRNAPALPVMTALTCLVAQFAHPAVSSLGEELVLQPDGGAIALYGPTWLSHNTPAGDLGRHLLPALSAAGGGRLGDRLLRGLAAYAAAGGDRSTLRVYTLLGDPALAVKR